MYVIQITCNSVTTQLWMYWTFYASGTSLERSQRCSCMCHNVNNQNCWPRFSKIYNTYYLLSRLHVATNIVYFIIKRIIRLPNYQLYSKQRSVACHKMSITSDALGFSEGPFDFGSNETGICECLLTIEQERGVPEEVRRGISELLKLFSPITDAQTHGCNPA